MVISKTQTINCSTKNHFICHINAGHKDLVEGLLICNADVSAVNNEGRTALHFAARQGNFAISIAQNDHAKYRKRWHLFQVTQKSPIYLLEMEQTSKP